jgi:carotenoid cleavage dioxygenase
VPKFVPVPWFRWNRYVVEGVIREQESGRPIPGLRVTAFDEDVIRDDHLGDAVTDAEGRFEIHFSDHDFKDVLESNPDIYLCIFAEGAAEPLHDTSFEVRRNASNHEVYEIAIPRERLPD